MYLEREMFFMTGDNSKASDNPAEQPRKNEGEMTVLLMEAASPASSDSPPPTAGIRDAGPDKRYVFTGLHAKGGIGRVWLARDRQLDRDVAIKELFPENAGNAKNARSGSGGAAGFVVAPCSADRAGDRGPAALMRRHATLAGHLVGGKTG